jgi:hypothetical protein
MPVAGEEVDKGPTDFVPGHFALSRMTRLTAIIADAYRARNARRPARAGSDIAF